MVSLTQNSFRRNLLILRVLGLYPPGRYQKLYKLYAIVHYLVFVVPVPVLGIIFLILTDNLDMVLISNNIYLLAELGMFTFKLIPFIFDGHNIRRSIKSLEWEIFQKFTDEHPTIAEDCARSCRMMFWWFSGCCWISLLTWGLQPILIHIYKLPIDVWLPFDPLQSTERYISCYIFVCLGVGHGAFSTGALDPLVAGLVCQAAGQFRILKHNLEHLSYYTNEVVKNSGLKPQKSVINKVLYGRICECIEHHNAILSYVRRYEDTFSFPVFCQFMASSFVICISTYALTMTKLSSFRFTVFIIYIIAMISQIFLHSYYGTILFEESDSVGNSVYMGNWYEYDIKSKKALILLMERSKKPVQVTAKKIVVLSLGTFATVLRRAYSLFAVLNSFNE